jgi:hypothetical protein
MEMFRKPRNGPNRAGTEFFQTTFFRDMSYRAISRRSEMITRATMIAVAIGGVVLAATPFAAANAQSGDALARAERACSNSGVRPYSNAYNACVDQAAGNFYRGAPDIAYDTAREIGSANRVCMSYGLDPHSLGYSQCVDNEVGRGADTVQALSIVDDTPHIAVARDSYGFGYDRQGNLLDAGGYVIRPVPLHP